MKLNSWYKPGLDKGVVSVKWQETLHCQTENIKSELYLKLTRNKLSTNINKTQSEFPESTNYYYNLFFVGGMTSGLAGHESNASKKYENSNINKLLRSVNGHHVMVYCCL